MIIGVVGIRPSRPHSSRLTASLEELHVLLPCIILIFSRSLSYHSRVSLSIEAAVEEDVAGPAKAAKLFKPKASKAGSMPDEASAKSAKMSMDTKSGKSEDA